jgi:hypothetical protein
MGLIFRRAVSSSCTRGRFPRFGIEGIEVRELSNREREMLIEEATIEATTA